MPQPDPLCACGHPESQHAEATLSERIERAATFSPCRRYRYTLRRTWSDAAPCMFTMLNPSTADAVDNDPTVERCERRARMWGFGGLIVTNIFAWRSTDPRALYGLPDPVGPENDAAILQCASEAGLVVCAWGNHGKLNGRGDAVRQMLARVARIHCLKLSKTTGQPWHPLYLGYDVKPTLWSPAGDSTQGATA